MSKTFKQFHGIKTKTDTMVEDIKETDSIKEYDEDSFWEFEKEFTKYLNDNKDELHPIHGEFDGIERKYRIGGILTHGVLFANNFEDLSGRIVYDFPEHPITEKEWNPEHHIKLNKIAEKHGYGFTGLNHGNVYIYGITESSEDK